MFSSTRYFLDYIYIYSPKYENYFYSLPPEAVSFITSKQDQYKIIYLDRSFTDAHIAFAFFNQINPVLYQKNVVRPDPDGFGFSHPTTLGRYQFGNKNLQNFLCHGDENVLFITNLSQVVPTWSFKGFSGVHTQVEIFDIKETRERYKKQETWKVCCPEG